MPATEDRQKDVNKKTPADNSADFLSLRSPDPVILQKEKKTVPVELLFILPVGPLGTLRQRQQQSYQDGGFDKFPVLLAFDDLEFTIGILVRSQEALMFQDRTDIGQQLMMQRNIGCICAFQN